MDTTRIPVPHEQARRDQTPHWREVLYLALAGLIPSCQPIESLMDLWEVTP